MLRIIVILLSLNITGLSEETYLGHKRYSEAQENNLVAAGRYRASPRIVMLLPEAASAFNDMQEDARIEEVFLVPISGYRSVKYQSRLFKRAVKKYGSTEKAARWVAPPGFSEHHTGLAIDIGDEEKPECDVELCFEKTDACKWLNENAGKYGFELLFKKTDASKVSYEPWHWRYLGVNDVNNTPEK